MDFKKIDNSCRWGRIQNASACKVMAAWIQYKGIQYVWPQGFYVVISVRFTYDGKRVHTEITNKTAVIFKRWSAIKDPYVLVSAFNGT